MIERHYDDEALISLIESQRDSSDAHLPACESCNEKLESFRMIAEALHDADVWDTRPLRTEAVPATIATLRAFADRTADEDTAAVAILGELLAGSREEWMPRLAEHPEWRTAGVVRGLIAGTSRAIDTMPPDAVAMTTLATDIAEHLDPASQPAGTIARLTGAAWRERAYALYYTGEITAAESALFAAERHLSYCGSNEYELARVGIVKALVNRALERLSLAAIAARDSARAFAASGDITRFASARLAEAQLSFSRSDFVGALKILEDTEKVFDASGDLDTRARILGNLGYCNLKLGRLDRALLQYEAATAIVRELDTPTELARLELNVAVVLATAGRIMDAQGRLEQVVEGLTRLGMESEAALARLEIAELLLLNRHFDQVEELCRTAMRSFERSGVAYTARALTALAFIREAAAERRVTPQLVKHVREYIRRLPNDATLLFALPPS